MIPRRSQGMGGYPSASPFVGVMSVSPTQQDCMWVQFRWEGFSEGAPSCFGVCPPSSSVLQNAITATCGLNYEGIFFRGLFCPSNPPNPRPSERLYLRPPPVSQAARGGAHRVAAPMSLQPSLESSLSHLLFFKIAGVPSSRVTCAPSHPTERFGR